MNALFAAAYVWSQVVIPGKNPQQAFGINNRGQIVVTNDDGSNGVYGHGQFTPLPSPPASCGCTAGGFAVNDHGVVVGITSDNVTGNEGGFTLANGVWSFFSWADYPNTEPRGINDQGLVVGWGFDKNTGANAGFRYDPSTGIFTNVTPGATGSPNIVQGINNRGRVAGSYVDAQPRKLWAMVNQPAARGDDHAFLSKTQIDGTQSRGRGINDFGVVLIDSNDPGGSGNIFAFVGNDSRGYQRVIAPDGDSPNRFQFCSGLNDGMQVICNVSDLDALGNTSNPILWIGTPADGDEQ